MGSHSSVFYALPETLCSTLTSQESRLTIGSSNDFNPLQCRQRVVSLSSSQFRMFFFNFVCSPLNAWFRAMNCGFCRSQSILEIQEVFVGEDLQATLQEISALILHFNKVLFDLYTISVSSFVSQTFQIYSFSELIDGN